MPFFYSPIDKWQLSLWFLWLPLLNSGKQLFRKLIINLNNIIPVLANLSRKKIVLPDLIDTQCTFVITKFTLNIVKYRTKLCIFKMPKWQMMYLYNNQFYDINIECVQKFSPVFMVRRTFLQNFKSRLELQVWYFIIGSVF